MGDSYMDIVVIFLSIGSIALMALAISYREIKAQKEKQLEKKRRFAIVELAQTGIKFVVGADFEGYNILYTETSYVASNGYCLKYCEVKKC